MSVSRFRRWPVVLCGLTLVSLAAPIARAQDLSVAIRVRPEAPGRALVEGRGGANRVWAFRNAYAGVLDLGNRIERFELYDAAGADVPVRKIAPGHYEAATDASRFRYEVNLAPPIRPSDAALVSWLNTERGLLMLGDLLPVSSAQETARVAANTILQETGRGAVTRVTVRFSFPERWSVYSGERQNAGGEFEVSDADRAVFVVGTHLRASQTMISGVSLNLIADGAWAFTDGEALDLAGQVLKLDHDIVGSVPFKRATLILLPFPQTVGANRWSAETRGATVTLLVGKLPSKTAALAQLSVPMTHELFHLWMPNGLVLDGNYDWFYEGFTIYHAARTAVRLGLLTFPEFLSAIARAYDAYAAEDDRDRWSLVEASQRRWTAGESIVYQKSMIVALLYDLKLRSLSKRKRSLDDLYREIFRQHSSPGAATVTRGNDAVINALSRPSGMQDFAGSYVHRAVTIDLPAELATFGLRVERVGLRTHISVSDQLSGRQRDLLRDLGYNDYVRPSAKGK